MSFPNALIGNPGVNKWQLPQLIENLLNSYDLNDSGLMARKDVHTKTLFRIKVNSRPNPISYFASGNHNFFSELKISVICDNLSIFSSNI